MHLEDNPAFRLKMQNLLLCKCFGSMWDIHTSLNLMPNLAQGPWQNAQMVHIQYICHLNFKEDRFLANNACNLCTKASNAHSTCCSV